MSIWTLKELNEQIAAYKTALKTVSTGQYYSISGRMLTRQNLAEIRATLEWLDLERQKLLSKSGPIAVRTRITR